MSFKWSKLNSFSSSGFEYKKKARRDKKTQTNNDNIFCTVWTKSISPEKFVYKLLKEWVVRKHSVINIKSRWRWKLVYSMLGCVYIVVFYLLLWLGSPVILWIFIYILIYIVNNNLPVVNLYLTINSKTRKNLWPLWIIAFYIMSIWSLC